MIDFIKDYFQMSSPLWLMTLLGLGALWLWRRPASRGPKWYFTAIVLLFWFVTTPVGAGLLVESVTDGSTPIATQADAHGADVVVVLGGGAMTAAVGQEVAGALAWPSLMRALEGARVFKLIGARAMVVSGGRPRPDRQLRPESEMLKDIVVKAGVPASAVIEEWESTTTHQQAVRVGQWLGAHQVQRFVLVTSPTHMRRSLAVFRAAGLDPVPSVTPIRSQQLRTPSWLVPNDESLGLSSAAVYDHAALLYYWARGWTRPLSPH